MKLISILKFCAVQGLTRETEFALIKMYSNKEPKTYQDWFNLLKDTFELGVEKQFGNVKEISTSIPEKVTPPHTFAPKRQKSSK